jgi:ABC-type sugar transport system substrate-binding protein
MNAKCLALAGAVLMSSFGLASSIHAQDKTTIGVVMYARDSQYWQQVERGIKDAGAKYNVDLQIVLNRRQLPTEAQVVEDLVNRKVKALVISPLDKDASATAMKAVKAQGIPIIEYNTFFADKSIAVNSIGVDNRELAASVGREAARYIKTELGGTAKIALVPLPAINPGSVIRKEGFMSALSDVKVTVVGEADAATPEQGATAVENMMRRDPGTQLIWASNSGSLAGIATTVSRVGGKVQLYGIDMSQELAKAMQDPASPVQAVADQQPYKLGYLAVEAAVKNLRGEKGPRDIRVPVRVYKKSDPAGLKEYLDLVQSLS